MYAGLKMFKLLILIGLLGVAVFTVVQGTTNGKGLLYPFDISSTLVCHQEVKLPDGTTRIEPESPLQLPFGRRVVQGNNPRVYLPQDTT